MGVLSHKTVCPRCKANGRDTSKDNLAVYTNESVFCFSCGFTIRSEDVIEQEGEMVVEFSEEEHDKLKKITGTDSKGFRGIRTEVSKSLGVRYQYSNNEVVSCFYPVTKNYQICGYKKRAVPKAFSTVLGETGKSCDLFMQWKFKTFSNTIMITGGELDSLSAYQMLMDDQKAKGKTQYDPVAVVSPTIGETAAYKQIQEQYNFFNQFKKIVVAMDSDDAGREAEKKIIEVLPEGKVYVMRMRYKDPNAYIWDNEKGVSLQHQQDFINDFWAAKPYTPDGVKSVEDAFGEISEELIKPRITLPHYMREMQAMMGGGIIQGRIANIIADTATGKSSHVNRMVYHWIFNSPVVPTIVSLEATAAQYVIEMLSIHLQKNLLWKMTGSEILDFMSTPEGIKAKNELCFKETGEPRFYIIDDRKGSIKNLESQMDLLYRKHGSKLFVVDVLSDLLRGSSEQLAEDHMGFQKALVKNGVTIINVMHTRKPPQSSDGTYRKVMEYDALGTGSFVQSAAYNIVLNRNKLASDPIIKNTTEVDLPKCRGGKTGSAGKWFYDFDSAQCYDLDDWLESRGVSVDF